ncbi:MAG: lectin, partial [Rhodanobacteraceae bacterium]
DQFVRVDVKADSKVAAPGGGRVGMDAQQIEKLYAGRVHASPGKYDPAAKILSVTPPRIKDVGLVFETDDSGVVKSWRIGVDPQIDFVEGCG